MFAPEALRKTILEMIADDSPDAFGPVATVKDGRPQVRTVHLRYLKELETLGFNTHTGSAKWKGLLGNPVLSGFIYQPPKLFQLRWEGTVKLLKVSDACSESDSSILSRMWKITRSDLRKIYWKEYLENNNESSDDRMDIDQICPTFSTVACFPTVWDKYEFTNGDYSESKRTLYTLTHSDISENFVWTSQIVSQLDGSH